MHKTRLRVVQQAIDVLLRHLDALPPSDRADHLEACVRECVREAELWRFSPPSDRERERLMKRLLAIHLDVVRLEAGRPSTAADRRDDAAA